MSIGSVLVVAWVCIFAVYKATQCTGRYSPVAAVCIGVAGGLALFALAAWALM